MWWSKLRLDMSQGLGMLLSKGKKAITGLRSLIRVESCGLVRNGYRGQVTGRRNTSLNFLPSNKYVMFREKETSHKGGGIYLC